MRQTWKSISGWGRGERNDRNAKYIPLPSRKRRGQQLKRWAQRERETNLKKKAGTYSDPEKTTKVRKIELLYSAAVTMSVSCQILISYVYQHRLRSTEEVFCLLRIPLAFSFLLDTCAVYEQFVLAFIRMCWWKLSFIAEFKIFKWNCKIFANFTIFCKYAL